MLPQHGGVPNFKLRIPAPVLILLALVLFTGLMLTISMYQDVDEGDVVAKGKARLALVITLLLSFFVLLAGTGRWWHPHLWKQGNSQRQHRHRRRHQSGDRHHHRH
jgi:hypothetical protein